MDICDQIFVMVHGIPGKMATAVAEEVLKQEDMLLFTASFTGPEIEKESFMLPESQYAIKLIKPDKRIASLRHTTRPHIVVDFTHPDAALANARFYCDKGFDFVMGTTMTQKDRSAIEDLVRNSASSALIAPNMAKQIVALQQAMQQLAEEHPGAFKGYNFNVTESHQHGKADTSGTARAMVGYFNELGIEFRVEDIVKIREPEQQRALGVPEQYLDAHGWHTYKLFCGEGNAEAVLPIIKTLREFLETSPAFEGYDTRHSEHGDANEQAVVRQSSDKTCALGLNYDSNRNLSVLIHNINGRKPYALGTLDAIRFLARKIGEEAKPRAYSMIDVLEAGM